MQLSDVDDEVEDKNDGDSDDDESGGDDDDRGNYEGNDDDNKGGPYLDGSGYFGTAKERCIKAPGWTFIQRFKTYALCKIPLSSTTWIFPRNSFSPSSFFTNADDDDDDDDTGAPARGSTVVVNAQGEKVVDVVIMSCSFCTLLLILCIII